METILCSHRENVVVKSQEHLWLIVPFDCRVGLNFEFCSTLEMALLRPLFLVISNAQHRLFKEFSF
jgi:hypothetical protein